MTPAEANLKAALRKSMELNGDLQRQKGPLMDSQKIVNVLGGLVLAFLGWWSNNIWQTVQTMQSQVTNLNIELAKNYVPRAEIQAAFDRIYSKLEVIDKNTKGARP